MNFQQMECNAPVNARLILVVRNAQRAFLIFLLINVILPNTAEAGTWLSFNLDQKSGGSDSDVMPRNRLFLKSKNQYPLREQQMLNQAIQEESNSKNIINLLEECNERNKRNRFTKRPPSNDLCNTLLSAVDYDLQNQRRR